jgi:NAD(P)H-dependent flavin oxidoreductase YrpB (nitropropane dioxygenase family)
VRQFTGAARNAAAFRKVSGRSWASLLREGRSMRRSHDLRVSQVMLAANAPMLIKAAIVDGRVDLGVLATGQVAGLIEDLPSCAELIERIMGEATETLKRLT